MLSYEDSATAKIAEVVDRFLEQYDEPGHLREVEEIASTAAELEAFSLPRFRAEATGWDLERHISLCVQGANGDIPAAEIARVVARELAGDLAASGDETPLTVGRVAWLIAKAMVRQARYDHS